MKQHDIDELSYYLKDISKDITDPYTLPIDIVSICSDKGIKIEKRLDFNDKAKLIIENSEYKIVLTRQPGESFSLYPFQRFLVGHELGHFFLIERGVKPTTISEYWKIEYLCHQFSRFTLLPDRLINKFFQENINYNANKIYSLSVQLSHQGLVTWHVPASRINDFLQDYAFFLIKKSDDKYMVNFSTLPYSKLQNASIKKHRDYTFYNLFEHELSPQDAPITLEKEFFSKIENNSIFSIFNASTSGVVKKTEQDKIYLVIKS